MTEEGMIENFIEIVKIQFTNLTFTFLTTYCNSLIHLRPFMS